MPSPAQESLIALANSIVASASPTPADPGKFVITLTASNPLQVPDALPIRTIAPGAVDLTLVMKNVRFTNANITSLTTVGGMPIQEFVTQILDGAATGGVPGLVASLTGNVPVVIDKVGSLLNIPSLLPLCSVFPLFYSAITLFLQTS